MLTYETYLALCSIAYGSTLIAGRLAVTRADRTDTLPPLPVPAQPDPYEVAYLRGGMPAVERLATLELLESGHLSVRRQEASFWRSRPARTILEQAKDGQGLPRYLQAALKRFPTPGKADELGELWGEEASRMQAQLEGRLRKNQLLAVDEARSVSRVARAIAVVCMLCAVVAVPHLYVAYGLSVNALIIAGIVLFGLTSVCEPARLSKRGNAYLARLQRAFRGRSAAGLSHATTAGGTNFALTVGFAIYGAEILTDTPYEAIAALSDSGDSGDGDGGDGGGDD
jgi:uncharacterized protein (TIGR04222 family)